MRILHARALLTRMQLEMYRGDRPAALRLLATLLREFMHLRAALAQAGFELLSSSAKEHEQVLRFGRRMAMLDKPNRSTWQLLAASSTLRHDDGLAQHAAHRLAAAVAFLQAVLGQRPERTACTHDAELHGHLGLLMHAQLALAASSRRGTPLRAAAAATVEATVEASVEASVEGDARLRMPGARGHAMAFEIDARAWTEPLGATSRPSPHLAAHALLRDEGDDASAQDDALEEVPKTMPVMAAVAERGRKKVGIPLPVRRGAATATLDTFRATTTFTATDTLDERDDENELSDSSGSVDVGMKDVGEKDADAAGDESEGQMASEEGDEDDDDVEDDESEYGGVLAEESEEGLSEEGFVGEAELMTRAQLDEEGDDDAGDSLGAMGDGEDEDEDEDEELEELDTEAAKDVEAVEEDEEKIRLGLGANDRPREDEANAAAEGPVRDDDGDGSEGGEDDVAAAVLEVDSSDTEGESEKDAEMDAAYAAAERAMAASSRGDDESEGEGGDPVHALRDLLCLSLPAALEWAHSAIRYLRHALERRPDSCLYAACLAQTLAFVHALTETHSGAAESVDVYGRDGEDTEAVTKAVTPMAEARQVLYALAHPNQRPCAIPAPTEAGRDAPVASAPAIDAPASMLPTVAPPVTAPAAITLPREPIPSVAARELWLHWLQQVIASDCL